MEIILILTSTLFGGLFAKCFFLLVEKQSKTRGISNNHSLNNYILPFSSALKYKINPKLLISESFGMISFGIFSFGLIDFYQQQDELLLFEVLIHFSFHFILMAGLLYLAVYDLINYSVPIGLTLKLLFFIVVVNIIIGVTRLAILLISDESSFRFFSIGRVDNIIAFILMYFVTYLLVFFSKERGIGKGDADINGFVGLALGFPGTIVFFFISLILGGAIGAVYSVKMRKLKNLIIPMVPILLLGVSIAIGFSERIIEALFA